MSDSADEDKNSQRAKAKLERKCSTGQDWSRWPTYDNVEAGLQNYWYPIQWSSEVDSKPQRIRLCGENIVVIRDTDGSVRALHDRCLHRGVPLSGGKVEFPGTLSCPYHGWTYRLTDGELCAIITDGPDSRMCGKVALRTYAAEERLGLVWIFIGDGEPHPLSDQLPEELVSPPKYCVGGRIEDRSGNWRLYAENGFDEGHAKYLHRTSLWRTFKVMPAWNIVRIEKLGRWLYRVEEERHWDAEFPGLGRWTNDRWWKIKPVQKQGKSLGNTGGSRNNDPYIENQDFPGFASLSLPGVLRIAYPQFIHYEFYVPIDGKKTKYVGLMVQFKTGFSKFVFYLKYLFGIRWLFHGQFSGQDHLMVDATDAPPERLYRPDVSLIEWRRMVEEGNPFSEQAVEVDSRAESEERA
jgi:phenylpropionate dioxygenase-like ring-hydroxylating dioxygenase large terminal subunit